MDLSSSFLLHQADSLLLYRKVLSDDIGCRFLDLLEVINRKNTEARSILNAYTDWFSALARQNCTWQGYLVRQILLDENPLTQQAQQTDWDNLPPALVAAGRSDLRSLQQLYACTSQQIGQWVKAAANLETVPVCWPDSDDAERSVLAVKSGDWGEAIAPLCAYYRQHGTGIFAQYRALRWTETGLVGISHPDPVRLSDLAGYVSQKQVFLENIEFLLSGNLALHVLLYGSRGSGKSSLVKAALNEFADRNLRLIEVSKDRLKDLATIVDRLRDRPQKFIIFVDDLSFEEDDDAFKALKVVLEGSVTARPENTIVCATSNRRHLIREFFDDRPRPRDADEVHSWDTMQEKLSFSDRFGLTLTFEPADQETYLEIVAHLAKQESIELE